MKLNADCIRAVLLACEKCTVLHEERKELYFQCVGLNDIVVEIEQEGELFPTEEVAYSLFQLVESHYIMATVEVEHAPLWGKRLEIRDICYLTPSGHELLSKIKNAETWKGKISPLLGKLGGVSLAVIESVASGIASAAIEKALAHQINV